LNNCVSPECISVDIVTQVNSTSSDTGPLSLQMLEEASKMLTKLANLQRQNTSTVSSKLDIMDKYHELF
jgi:hypothetical protein